MPLRLCIKRHLTVALPLMAMTTYAQAGIFSSKICSVFNSVADNSLYSVLTGIGLAGLLVAHSLDEGDNKVKTGAIRIGLAGIGLVNVQTLSNMVTGASWGC